MRDNLRVLLSTRTLLLSREIRYWEYVPSIFEWKSDIDHNPICPLHDTYQLVRNILASCVKHNGTLNASAGHAVLLYDERNPKFMANGNAMCMREETRNALREKSLLHKCTCQRQIDVLRRDNDLLWLTNALAEK